MSFPGLKSKRFTVEENLKDTLQGFTYKAYDHQTKQFVVVKQTYIWCAKRRVCKKGKPVPEDIKKERGIIKFLTNKSRDPDAGFVQLIHQWDDKQFYYYAMQYCQDELFDLTKTAFDCDSQHTRQQDRCEQSPCKQPTEWMTNIRHIFQQLVTTVAWMHSVGVCHLDLSLENTLIFDKKKWAVKIIDFGIAEQFDLNNKSHTNFQFNKRVGKRGYMAPEVYREDDYDCRKADIWSLGVMLFMMLVGSPPYNKADVKRDAIFRHIMDGRMRQVLAHWKRLQMITEQALDLIENIFRPEKQRICMEELLAHPYVNMPDYINKLGTVDHSDVEQKTVETQSISMPDHNPNMNSYKSSNSIAKLKLSCSVTSVIEIPFVRPDLSREEFLQFAKDTWGISQSKSKHGQLKVVKQQQWNKVFHLIEQLGMDEALLRTTSVGDFEKLFESTGISSGIMKILYEMLESGLKNKQQ